MPASPSLALVEAPGLLWRVERASPPLRFAHINAVDVALPSIGNRFDVLGAGVLYAATTQEGAFAETLAGFRPAASLIAKMVALGEDPSGAAQVPREWRLARRLRSLKLPTAIDFVDIDAPATHTYLTHHAAELLADLGVDTLDVATVRGRIGPSRAHSPVGSTLRRTTTGIRCTPDSDMVPDSAPTSAGPSSTEPELN